LEVDAMSNVWEGEEHLQFNIVQDRTQPVNSVRYFTFVDDGAGRERRFDLYVPDVVFNGEMPPYTLEVVIRHNFTEPGRTEDNEA
jgi:hypothetical protein